VTVVLHRWRNILQYWRRVKGSEVELITAAAEKSRWRGDNICIGMEAGAGCQFFLPPPYCREILTS